MTLSVLRDDALRSTPDGFELLLSLPWIRSLPSASLRDVSVQLDGAPVAVEVAPPGEWWHPNDRAAVRGHLAHVASAHEVTVAFTLAIPYLHTSGEAPLMLPFEERRILVVNAPGSVPLPDGWILAASAFNWTPEIARGDRSPADLAVESVADGVAATIEIEAGQVWRGFPHPTETEIDALRDRIDRAGGRVSIVGVSIDDWAPDDSRRTDDERLAFLLPQLRAAARLGAGGVRLPLGQAGPSLLRRLQAELHDLGLTLFEEAQGHQTPVAAASAFADIAELDDPRIRVLIDISMLMPALPVTYLKRLRHGGLSEPVVRVLETQWQDPATHRLVIDQLRTGSIPPALHTLVMNMLVRFGRSDAADLRQVLPMTGAVHLKFWDLDDADGRVCRPIRSIADELRAAGFTGTLCSEWGGHEWLDDRPGPMTRDHLALARTQLALGG